MYGVLLLDTELIDPSQEFLSRFRTSEGSFSEEIIELEILRQEQVASRADAGLPRSGEK
jgi:hypothetical protein